MNTTLHSYVRQALAEAQRTKEAAGRSGAGRHLSIVTTKLEELEALLSYYGLADVGGDQFNPGSLDIPETRPPEEIVASLVASADRDTWGVDVRAEHLPDPMPDKRMVTRWYVDHNAGVERAVVQATQFVPEHALDYIAAGIRAFVFGLAPSAGQGPHRGGRPEEWWQTGYRAAHAALRDQDDPRYGSTTDLCHRAAKKVGVDPQVVQPS